LQAARQLKGILNKLTPENFDRLLQQVLDIVNDAELLHATIRLVFENAVAQPTFSFMYAQLCDKLSKVGLLGPQPCLAHVSLSLAFMSSQTPGTRALCCLFHSCHLHSWAAQHTRLSQDK
jgi:hypothetical protein